MEISWSTFLLEILNFLVLVWILKHFLYLPVRGLIERRRLAIEERLAQAARTREEALDLERTYQGRLEEWEQERGRAREELQRELAQERTRLDEALHEELRQEAERERVLRAREAEELRRQQEQQAIAQAERFAARLLGRLAGPELDERLLEVFLEDLPHLAEEQRERIREHARKTSVAVRVTSAAALAPAARERLLAGLTALLGEAPRLALEEDSDLVAGVRVRVGPYVLGANVRDELQLLRAAGDDDG